MDLSRARGSSRRRTELILRVPTLPARSTPRFTARREVAAGFAAERTGRRPDDPAPQVTARAVPGDAIAAYEHWPGDPGPDPGTLPDNAMRQLAAAFGTVLG